jgi:hypothetical protein
MIEEFKNQWLRFRQSDKVRLFRIDTAPAMHHDLTRLLRALEMSPDNRSPYLILTPAFAKRPGYYAAAIGQLKAAYGTIREGLAKDGVTVGELMVALTGRETPEEGLVKHLQGMWNQVQKQFEYLMVILLPSAIEDKNEWPKTVEQLYGLVASYLKVRLAVADVPEGLLVSFCSRFSRRSLSGRFFVSDKTVQDYLFKVAAGGWAAVAGNGAAAASPPAGAAFLPKATGGVTAAPVAAGVTTDVAVTRAAAESSPRAGATRATSHGITKGDGVPPGKAPTLTGGAALARAQEKTAAPDASASRSGPVPSAAPALSAGPVETPVPTGQPKVLPPDQAIRFRTLMAAAAAASGENKPKQAIEALQEARLVCQRLGLAAEEGIVVMAIGNTHVATNQLDLAIQYYEESVAVAQRGDVSVVMAQAGLALGSTLFRKQEYERAGKAYEQAGEDAKACESDVLYIEALRMAGTCHNLRQKPDEAMRCWKDALQTSQHMSPAELQLSTWEQAGQAFTELCRKRGLSEQAKSVASQLDALKRQVAVLPAVAH